MIEDTLTTTKKRGIQSVEIGMRVLEAVASFRGPASLSAIASCAALSASQAHRYLSSLIAAKMVEQERESGHYDLSSGAIRIGLAALARVDMFQIADSVFADLAKTTKRTCLVTVWGDAGPTIIRWFDGDPPVVTSLAIGSVLPLLRSATGRIFYSFAEPATIERLGASKILEEKKRIGGAHSKIRSETRRHLLARVEGDLIPGLAAVAAPVFDLQGRLVLVGSVLSNLRLIGDDDDRGAEDLRAACRRLTESIGGEWPDVAMSA